MSRIHLRCSEFLAWPMSYRSSSRRTGAELRPAIYTNRDVLASLLGHPLVTTWSEPRRREGINTAIHIGSWQSSHVAIIITTGFYSSFGFEIKISKGLYQVLLAQCHRHWDAGIILTSCYCVFPGRQFIGPTEKKRFISVDNITR